MKSIFDENAYQELLDRIDALSENSKRQWGKMSVGQMAWHCQFPLATGIENKKPKKRGNIFVRWFFKKMMYNDTPIRKNMPTAPAIKAKEEKNFSDEHQKLRRLVTDFHGLKTRASWNPHPLFGSFTHEQWGQMQYKHLDHHLTQFGV